MDDEHLKQTLIARAEREIPDNLDLRQQIYGKMNMNTTPTTSMASSQTTKHLKVPFSRLLLVAALLLLATATYAVYQSVIQPDPGLAAVQTENLITSINQTQAVTPLPADFSDLKVHLDYAYADSNRITVGFHLSGQSAAENAVQLYANPTLTDASGTPVFWIPSSGQQVMSAPAGSGDFNLGGIMSFDASGVTGAPAVLNLNLNIDVAYTTAALRADDPYGMMMAGQTGFNFAVPFNPGKTVEVNQSVTAGNTTIELQRVVIAPSLTRLEICATPAPFGSTDEHWLDWQAAVTVDVNGQTMVSTGDASFAGLHGQPLEREAACRALVIPEKLVQSGSWTLTLNSFRNSGTGEQITGPWVMTFNVQP